MHIARQNLLVLIGKDYIRHVVIVKLMMSDSQRCQCRKHGLPDCQGQMYSWNVHPSLRSPVGFSRLSDYRDLTVNFRVESGQIKMNNQCLKHPISSFNDIIFISI